MHLNNKTLKPHNVLSYHIHILFYPELWWGHTPS